MNIEQARAVPLYIVLEKIGAVQVSEKNNRAIYFSPLRVEKTPSFHVDIRKNVWYDFGEGIGGSTVRLVALYLERCGESHTTVDALRWIRNMTHYSKSLYIPKIIEEEITPVRLIVKDTRQLNHIALKKYLGTRGIHFSLAKIYLKELSVLNQESGRTMFVLGLRNECGGYELRNSFFKGSVSPKTISFIRGTVPKPETINVFEGFMDFLSILAHEKKEKLYSDTIILNSVSNINKAIPYIDQYGYKNLLSWFDNDNAGEKGRKIIDEFVSTQKDLKHFPMNEKYEPHKDVNDWHIKNIRLSIQ